jgi:hypothetical protein
MFTGNCIVYENGSISDIVANRLPNMLSGKIPPLNSSWTIYTVLNRLPTSLNQKAAMEIIKFSSTLIKKPKNIASNMSKQRKMEICIPV